MLGFKDFLNEALVTFGGKAYPQFNQVVILAGGAGSGKGFISEKLLGITGKTLDVDHLKGLVMASTKLAAKVKEETGHDMSKLNLRNPKDVALMHQLVADVYGVSNKNEATLFKSIAAADPRRKPNLIFDVTLKDEAKMKKISAQVQELGYAKEDIHLVWVANDIKVAMKQNQERERVVPTDILVGTHKGAASTIADILNSGSGLKRYMDGDIWIVFNKRGDDANMKFSKNGGEYIVDANYFKLKSKGKTQKSVNELTDEVKKKIASYVPGKVADKFK